MTDPLVDGTRAAELVAVLTARGETVATAESLTAGLLTATIAGVPGASNVLRGGLIVYATDLKATLAGVDRVRLAEDGPVAESTARALADGARARCGADWGVGLTGVAGPDMQDGHPVGTVFLSISGASGTSVHELGLAGDRWQIRKSAVSTAVSGLLDRVQETSAG
ncbi:MULTISPECIES: CinA family protein [unclassified Rhodococcus (in: high G+C Gram-positive bacteria)]|uniref:CinA family protein n=1 Tax=unclassified Rhodococcus (in: high G+C Gram-positive bacteria) TaxID=192944 RepID=UPI00163A883D|nr:MULTISPECIES: nicotinamide-nucleotide amidohydrolase family protein [unclassified Rhodococcus (in: high G+C Gram-positive bacteria)]MBC2643864.1 nicotinamide-nucleotide amidohydrolase family protein [Rhodococcus sp. 3A]MBC2891395.1 nicotinamide-nucleotide amidohydrolase family protein [Rhodococcus sp. 4CII]